MENFFDKIKENSTYFKQISIDDQLITEYVCPIETKKATLWSHRGYFIYVIEGKKIWHVAGRSYELTPGKCYFIKKSAHIIEQFFDARFCLVMFFVSEEFVCNIVRPLFSNKEKTECNGENPIIHEVATDDTLHGFFHSVAPFFLNKKEPNRALLELKFRELIVNVISNPLNPGIRNYFCSLLSNRPIEDMKQVMEENFLYNLSINEFARLAGRSLSSFKRDFQLAFNTTPGKWLLSRRLTHSKLIIETSHKTISEVAFECGFENASHFSRAFKQHFGYPPTEHKLISK